MPGRTHTPRASVDPALLDVARGSFEAIRDQFLDEVRTPQRVLDGAAILMKHFKPGPILDVGSGQAEVFSVIARQPGYECHCCDDFNDSWHHERTAETLMERIAAQGVEARRVADVGDALPYPDEHFEGVFCCDVIEHLHHTPRFLMSEINRVLRPGGSVAIGMPNSVNLRKRIDVLRGRTNYVALDQFWNDGREYRGHVREYTPDETVQFIEWAGFTPDCMYMLDWQVVHRLNGLTLKAYRMLSPLFRTARDSYIVVGTKA